MATGTQTRHRVDFFVSYARADKRFADDLLDRLKVQLGPSLRYEYLLWRDTDIFVGERWYERVEEALDCCQLGLLLLSPEFLGSEFITSEELPRFVGMDAKPVIPVLLKSVQFEHHDLKGLTEHQIFRWDETKPYADCCLDRVRRRFAEQLFVEIERRLDSLLGRLRRF